MARSKIKTVKIEDWSGGLQEFSSPFWANNNEATFNNSINNQVPGELNKGEGYLEVSSSTGSDGVKGLGVLNKDDGTNTVVRLHGSDFDRLIGTTWTNVTSTFDSNTTDRAEFADGFISGNRRIVMASGFNDEVYIFADLGGTGSNVDDIYAKHVEMFRGRVYLGNVKIDSDEFIYRVLFSELNEVKTFDTDNDYIDDIGEPITGLKVFASKLHIFTEDKLFAYDGYSLSEITGNYGTTSGRSMQIAQGRMIWYNRSGVYMYSGASSPVLVSRKVQNIIDSIEDPYLVDGGVDKYGRYKLYIGDITYNGTDYNDVVLTYDVLIDSWSFESDKPFGPMIRISDGGNFKTYAGDVDSKKVWSIDDGYSNNGNDIDSLWETPKIGLQTVQNIRNSYRLYVSYKPTGNSEYITVKYRLDSDSDWSQIEGTDNNLDLSGSNDINVVKLSLPSQLQGRFIQFQFSHSSNSGGFTLYEMRLEGDEIQSNI